MANIGKPLSNNTRDNEQNKFGENAAGEVAVRVIGDLEVGDIQVDLGPIISKDPVIFNVTMTTSGQEYSLDLPLSTKRFQMNIRDHLSKYTVSYVSEGDYLTKKPGVVYSEEGLELEITNRTLYFKGFKDNLVMEIITWS